MPTTTSAAAKSFRGARLIKFLYKARRQCRATYRSVQAGRLLLRSLPAIVMVSMLVPPPVAAQAPAGNSVAAEVQSSASGKLKKFYRPRGYWPLWVHEGELSPSADRLIELVSSAELDGLDPDDYDPDELREVVKKARSGSSEALAKAELKLSRTFARYVSDVRRKPSIKITYLDRELEPERLTEAAILRAAALVPSFADYMDDAGWMSPIYMRLRDAYGKYRDHWDGLPKIKISDGALLRTGDKGERVRMLRRRLGVPDGAIFDKVLAKKLRTFQAEHGLPDDAIAGSATIAALNRGSAYYERLIQLNMERARVLPGPWTRHIIVDAVTARLWLYNSGKMQGTMRVVVGKPTEQTPMLAGMMRYAIFNPYWNVPSDLVQRRIAPKVLDGATLKGMRYEALSDWTANASVLDPANIDWSAIAQGRENVRVRQLPGRNNAMGRMKFMFPNDLGIYLHDTPDKSLFSEKERQFSSGCVRLEDAPRLAKWLFGKKPKLESDVAEQQVPLPEPVPVYLSYLTVAPTDRGIAFLEDAYGRDGDQLERLAKR